VYASKITGPNNEIWYTDGSGISNYFGAGVWQKDNQRVSIPMGSLSTLFQAEVKAIPRCTE